jgi:teichuronic acid biosynthesis glycosyltransferase TuaH
MAHCATVPRTDASFVIFGAELPWIFPLAAELARYASVYGIELSAGYTPFRKRVWPFDAPNTTLKKEAWTYPPGFNGTLGALFAPLVRARLDRVLRRIDRATGGSAYVVTPHPHFAGYLERIDPERLVYINYDNHAPNENAADDSIPPREDAIVARVGTILCNSRFQTLRFQKWFPSKADAIFHVPHGVHELFLNPQVTRAPEPNTVCAIGYLSARYDWLLVHDVITKLPFVKFYFVGEIVVDRIPGQAEDWQLWLNSVLELPNVVHVRGLKHRETAQYYWNTAANWMPYKPDLPFVRASCPLKLTDGLASGRPIVSSDVPECRLYPEWISVYTNAADAATRIVSALDADPMRANKRATAQIEFARRHTWASRADRVLAILEEKSAGAAVRS